MLTYYAAEKKEFTLSVRGERVRLGDGVAGIACKAFAELRSSGHETELTVCGYEKLPKGRGKG